MPQALRITHLAGLAPLQRPRYPLDLAKLRFVEQHLEPLSHIMSMNDSCR